MMTNWKGRQVIQPSEQKKDGVKEVPKSLEESKPANNLIGDSTVIV